MFIEHLSLYELNIRVIPEPLTESSLCSVCVKGQHQISVHVLRLLLCVLFYLLLDIFHVGNLCGSVGFLRCLYSITFCLALGFLRFSLFNDWRHHILQFICDGTFLFCLQKEINAYHVQVCIGQSCIFIVNVGNDTGDSIKSAMDRQVADENRMEKERMSSAERVKTARITAVKDIATAFFKRQKSYIFF